MNGVVMLLGPPGAGKGDQAKLLADRLGGTRISSGDVLREEAKTNAGLRRIQQAGFLVPEEMLQEFTERAIRAADPDSPLILEGVARKPKEVPWLLHLLEDLGRPIWLAVVLVVDEKVSRERVAFRADNRPDDDPEKQTRRWDEFRTFTQPALAVFEQYLSLIRMDGVGTRQEIHERIVEALSRATSPSPVNPS